MTKKQKKAGHKQAEMGAADNLWHSEKIMKRSMLKLNWYSVCSIDIFLEYADFVQTSTW